jgi:hypothetical protein
MSKNVESISSPVTYKYQHPFFPESRNWLKPAKHGPRSRPYRHSVSGQKWVTEENGWMSRPEIINKYITLVMDINLDNLDSKLSANLQIVFKWFKSNLLSINFLKTLHAI